MAMNSNDQQFQQIYEEFHTRIFRYLARMVGEGAAEDLAQDVFVKVGLSLESFRGDSHLNTWIYRIATNTAIDWLRRASSRREQGRDFLSDTEADDEDTGCLRTSAIESEDRVIRQEMNGCIRAVIDTLPQNYRSVIILSELEGLQDIEIAEVLAISLQAAKIRLHRARARLRKELEKTCVLYHDERNELACDRK